MAEQYIHPMSARLYEKTMVGPLERVENKHLPDLNLREWLTLAPPGGGHGRLPPKPFLRAIELASLSLLHPSR